jgi:hypothetical protein
MTRLRPSPRLVASLLAVSGLASGCGGGSHSSSSSSASTIPVRPGPQRSVSDVTDCLNAAGLPVTVNRRPRGVSNVKTTAEDVGANINVFPSAQAASRYVSQVQDTLVSSGDYVEVQGNVMVATDNAFVPADQSGLNDIKHCAF